MLSNIRLKANILLVAAILMTTSAEAGFNARLQGQSRGSSAWSAGNLQGWRDLDVVPCRVLLTGGPANNKTITIEFDHMQGRNPAIDDLSGFAPSANVVLLSKPKLSAPANSTRWTYTFSIKLKDRNPGSVRFNARLAAGAHLNGGSSVGMRGSPSLGSLQIHKPSGAGSSVDLSVIKTGPAETVPGEVITYSLAYSNKSLAIGKEGHDGKDDDDDGKDRDDDDGGGKDDDDDGGGKCKGRPKCKPPCIGKCAGKAICVRLTDVLPPDVTLIADSIGAGRVSGNTITWNLPDLNPGEAGTVFFRVRVNANLGNGHTFTNTACILSACPDANLSDNKSSVITRVVLNPNHAPIANPETYHGTMNQAVGIAAPGVLANDTDADGDALTAILVTTPSHGTVTLNADGSFQYVPSTAFTGADSFAYKANDGLTDSELAAVTIVISAPDNHPPTANADTYMGMQNTTLTIAAPGVLANDTDLDGHSLTAILVTLPSHGAVTLSADGSFQYVPDNNFSGADSFVYNANDGELNSQPTTVTIIVGEPENLPPTVTLVNPTNGAIYIEGMDISVVAEAFDADGTIARVDFFAGPALLGSTGEMPYQILLTNAAAGEYVFQAQATDNDGASAVSAPVNIMVLEHAPYAAGPFRLNRQTGLFEQTVTIFNPTPVSIPAIRLFIVEVRTGATVWNATGTLEGIPYIDVRQSISSGGSAEVLIEYYTPDMRVAPQPRFLPELLEVDGGTPEK